MEQSQVFRGQGMMLMFISDHDGLTHSEVADKLNISPAAATKVIKRLEEQGFLQRMSDEKDERLSRVFIQDKGRALVGGLQAIFVKFNEQTFQDFSEEEMDQFEDYLVRILYNLQENNRD